MAQKIAGVAYVKVDGTQYALRGNLVVSPDDIERTGVAGQDGVHGFTEAPRVPFIQGDFSDGRDVSLEQIRRITDATVTAELANGKTYVLRNAWTASARELNTAEGSFQIRFEGQRCEELR